MYCWQCGAKNPDEGRFCTKCGAGLVESSSLPLTESDNPVASVVVPPSQTETAEATGRFGTTQAARAFSIPVESTELVASPLDAARQSRAATAMYCPNCGQIDFVQRANALLTDGTTTGSTVTQTVGATVGASVGNWGGKSVGVGKSASSSISGHQMQTELARRLGLDPTGIVHGRCSTEKECLPQANGYGFAAFLIGFFVLLILAGKAGADSTIAIGFAFIVSVVLSILVFQFRKTQIIASLRRYELSREYQTIEGRKRRWGLVAPQLCYCGRCDMIFVPGLGAVSMPEDKQGLIDQLEGI